MTAGTENDNKKKDNEQNSLLTIDRGLCSLATEIRHNTFVWSSTVSREIELDITEDGKSEQRYQEKQEKDWMKTKDNVPKGKQVLNGIQTGRTTTTKVYARRQLYYTKQQQGDGDGI